MSDPNLNLLFPTEPPAQTPDWFKVRQGEAESRLMGQHGAKGAASAIFPNDKPADPAAQKPVQAKAPEDVAAALFRTEKPQDFAASHVAAVIEPWALSAQIGGDTALADEWREASRTLAEDFTASGMDADDVRDVMELAREALGNTMPGLAVSEDRLIVEREKAETWMVETGVTDAEIDAARRMIDDLDLRTPGLRAYLDGTGMGNDQRVIQKAIKEARRRGYI